VAIGRSKIFQGQIQGLGTKRAERSQGVLTIPVREQCIS